MVGPIVSDFKLVVPVVLASLGQQRLLEIMEQAREDLGLGEQREFWSEVAKYATLWAQDCVDAYRAEKLGQSSV
jgi:hypothetical protein